MELEPAIRNELLASMPKLRSFALTLCGTIDRADDLVQETLLRAIVHIKSFRPGTNLSAWLAAILRNIFISQYRKQRREFEDVEGNYVGTLKSILEQTARDDFFCLDSALAKLPSEQRQALMLVSVSDLSYDEAAAQCACAAGTIKSRVHRTRARLIKLLA